MDISIYSSFLPHTDGITEDERRTIAELLAKGSYTASATARSATPPGT